MTRLANYGLVVFMLVTGVLISALGWARASDSPAILGLGVALVLFGLILGYVVSRLPG